MLVCVYQLPTCLIPVAVESKVQTQCVDNKENWKAEEAVRL